MPAIVLLLHQQQSVLAMPAGQRASAAVQSLIEALSSKALETYFGSSDDAAASVAMLFGATSSADMASEDASILSQYFGSAEEAAVTVSALLRVPSEDNTPAVLGWSLAKCIAPANDDESEASVGCEPSSPRSPARAGSFPLLDLPTEILDAVLDVSPTRSLICLASTSKALQTICDDATRWQEKAQQRFRPAYTVLDLPWPPAPALNKAGYFELNARWLARAASAAGLVLVRIDGHVYDVTRWLDEHPGGPALILAAAGTDASRAWHYVEHSVRTRSHTVARVCTRTHTPTLPFASFTRDTQATCDWCVYPS